MNIANTNRSLKFEGSYAPCAESIANWLIINKKKNKLKALNFDQKQIDLFVSAKINLLLSKTKKYYQEFRRTKFFQELLTKKIVYPNHRGDLVLTEEVKIDRSTYLKLLRIINWKVNHGKKHLIFRSLTKSAELRVFHTLDAYRRTLKRLKVKDQLFLELVDEFEKIVPSLFDWNIVNDLTEKMIFDGNSFSHAFVAALKEGLDQTEDVSSESVALEYFEYRRKLNYAHGFEQIHYHWCLLVQEWKEMLKKYLVWSEKVELLLRNFLLTAERINWERKY